MAWQRCSRAWPIHHYAYSDESDCCFDHVEPVCTVAIEIPAPEQRQHNKEPAVDSMNSTEVRRLERGNDAVEHQDAPTVHNHHVGLCSLSDCQTSQPPPILHSPASTKRISERRLGFPAYDFLRVRLGSGDSHEAEILTVSAGVCQQHFFDRQRSTKKNSRSD